MLQISPYEQGRLDYEVGNYQGDKLGKNAEQDYYRGWQTRHQEYVDLRRTELFKPLTPWRSGFIDYLSGHDRRVIFPFKDPKEEMAYQAGQDEAKQKIRRE